MKILTQKFNTKYDTAVYVIDQNGVVLSKFIDTNYVNRVDIEELVNNL